MNTAVRGNNGGEIIQLREALSITDRLYNADQLTSMTAACRLGLLADLNRLKSVVVIKSVQILSPAPKARTIIEMFDIPDRPEMVDTEMLKHLKKEYESFTHLLRRG